MASLRGKVVIITGASSGIGASTALHLAQFGPKLVLAARNTDKLKTVSLQCQTQELTETLIVECDMLIEDHLRRLVDTTLSEFGQIDALVNNAGSGKFRTFMDTSLELLDDSMKLNVRAPFFLSQLCVPYLLKTQGGIVNVSSISAKDVFPNAIAYCTSKAALDHFTRTLAIELAQNKIRVNCVNPGVTITNFHLNAGISEETYKSYLESQTEFQPLGGACDPKEVAKAIAFLASDESSFITGVTLIVDGGRHLMSSHCKTSHLLL